MPRQKSASRNKKVVELVEGEGARKQGAVMGIDVAKDEFQHCIVNENAILAEAEIQYTKAGIKSLITTIKRRKVTSVAMESTSEYHLKLLFALMDAGIDVLLANPQQTKETQGKKTDKLDARRIAIAHRDGRLKPSVISPKEIMELRKATRAMTRAKQNMTKSKQRLNQTFHFKDVDLKALLKSDWGRTVLQSLFQDDVDVLLEKHASSRMKPNQRAKLRENLVKFKASCDEIEVELHETEMEQLTLFENHANRYENTCWMVVKRNDHVARAFRTLLGIPNVGPATSIGTVAELVSISHFEDPDQLVKWAGLAPKVKQSGHAKHVTGKLHKGGNKYLRRHLTLACMNMYAKGAADHPIAAYIREKYASTGKYWEAIVAGARKLLRVMWYMLKHDTAWSPPGVDASLLAELNVLIDRKIRHQQSTIKKCEALKRQLANESMEIMCTVRSHAAKHRSNILHALMKSV